MQRLVHRLTVDHTGSLALDRHVEGLALDGALAVNRFAQHVDHATQHAFSDLHRCNGVRALGGAAFLQIARWLKQHHAHVVFLEVEDDAANAIFKFDQFAGLHTCQSVNAGDSVSHLEDGANFLELSCTCRACELLAEDAGDFCWVDISHQFVILSRSEFGLVIVFREFTAKRLDLALHRGVDHLVSDMEDVPSKDFRIDLFSQFYLAFVHFGHLGEDAGPQVVCQCHGRGHGHRLNVAEEDPKLGLASWTMSTTKPSLPFWMRIWR